MEPAAPGPRTGPPRRPSAPFGRQLPPPATTCRPPQRDRWQRRRPQLPGGRPVRCPRYRQRGHPHRPPGHREPEQSLARDLPETALRAASRSLTTQPSAAPATCAIVWVRVALGGVASPPRIDGKDGVADSIPAGSSTTERQARPGLVPGLAWPERAEPLSQKRTFLRQPALPHYNPSSGRPEPVSEST